MKSIDKTRFLAAMSLSVALASTALADSPAIKQWVLATAKATGAGGEQFVSSLRIVNPGTVDANVTLVYLAQSPFDGGFAATGDNTNADTRTFKVGAGKMLPIEDVIGSQFGGAAPFGITAGGFKVLSDQPVSVLSRTYVANGLSSTGKPGTYGFSIPAQVDAQAIGLNDIGYVPYIAASPNTTSGFRCNFIMLNTVAATTTLNVALKKADGSVVGQRDYTLGPLSTAQQGNIASSFGYAGPDENLFVVVTVKSGGPVVVGTSIIDNAISSLNYAPPTKTGNSVAGLQDGVYGVTLKDDGYATAIRIELVNGAPVYLFGVFVWDPCLAYRTLRLVSPYYGGSNLTSTKNPDGSYNFSGTYTTSTTAGGVLSLSAAGTLSALPDGGITGSIAVTAAANDSVCPGTSHTFQYQGHFSAPLTY